MKIKRISGILIGTSAVLVSALTLTSCGGNDVEFKSYKTESTKEDFEKAYNSFIEEKKTSGYDLTVYNSKNESIKSDNLEVTSKNEETSIETYDAITAVLYTYDAIELETKGAGSEVKESGKIEKIYQTDNGLNTIINVTKGTYTSLAYNASAAKTRTSSVYFNNYVDYYKLVDESNEAYSCKYYADDSVYTLVVSYDLAKDSKKDQTVGDTKITLSDATYELTIQFYGIDSEYFIGYKLTNNYTETATEGSNTTKTVYQKSTSKYARLFNVKQSIENFDLTKYKKDYSGYME